MATPLNLPPLLPGDTLLYSHKGFFDTAVRFMTRSRFTHVEGVVSLTLAGAITIAGSRNGIGPNLYPFDPTVQKILRPKGSVNMTKAIDWFNVNARGKGYGYFDLVKFLPNLVWLVPKRLQDKGMICSTFWDEFLKAGGFDAFANDFDPGEVTPRDFDESAAFDVIWQA